VAESFKLFAVPLKSPVNIDDIFSFFYFPLARMDCSHYFMIK